KFVTRVVTRRQTFPNQGGAERSDDYAKGQAAKHRRESLDPELLDPIPQCPKTDPEHLRRRRLVVPRLLERLDDRVALDLLELRAERRAVVPERRRATAATARSHGSRSTPAVFLMRRPQLDVLDVDLIP